MVSSRGTGRAPLLQELWLASSGLEAYARLGMRLCGLPVRANRFLIEFKWELEGRDGAYGVKGSSWLLL